MFSHVRILCLVGLMLTGSPCVLASDLLATAAAPGDSGLQVADLKDQLEGGLRARLPREFAFIDQVVDKVHAGELPLEMVMSTFQWARRKRPYPFPYFERGLRLRAAKEGIDL
jgi:hypothetical protein